MPPSKVIVLDDPPAGYTYTHRKGWRERAKVQLDSRAWQWVIIALVIVDACLVATDIILASVYCSRDHPPHDVEVAEKWLRYGSICILSFFVLEWLLEAYVHGFHRWVQTPLHLIDLIIVCVSLALEITALAISESAVELGGLLVVFRLWRVVRVMHAVGEVEHQKHKDVHSELEMANMRLENMNAAHHAIIKELHSEYTRRIHAITDDDPNTNISGDPAPPLDEMMRIVSMHSDQLRQSVSLHTQSMSRRHAGGSLLASAELSGKYDR
eukprot:jgi/Ulvmu1/3321/UM155_0004.1